MARPRKRPLEPIGPATIPGERIDPRIPPDERPREKQPPADRKPGSEPEQPPGTESERHAQESESAFEQAITRTPPD